MSLIKLAAGRASMNRLKKIFMTPKILEAIKGKENNPDLGVHIGQAINKYYPKVTDRLGNIIDRHIVDEDGRQALRVMEKKLKPFQENKEYGTWFDLSHSLKRD